MSFSYTYVLGTNFTATNIDITEFQTTVAGTSGLSTIQYILRSGTSVTLYFSSSIVGANLTALSGLVSSYVYVASSEPSIVDVSSTQVLSNKQLTTTDYIVDVVDNTKKLGFALVGMTTATQLTLASSLAASRTYTIPDGGAASSFLITNSTGTQTISSGNLAFSSGSSVLTIANTTASTSSSTGALQVAGGAYLGNFYTKMGTVLNPGSITTLYIDCQNSTTNIGQLVFSNTNNTGNFAIYGDGGDLYWQGGGGKTLQLAAWHGITLLGGRMVTTQPAFVAGLNAAYNVTIQNTNNSIGLIVQGSGSQTASLQEWQNSSTSVLSKVGADGSIAINNSNASTGIGTGALQVTGGAYIGSSSLFNADITATSVSNKITIPTYTAISSSTTSTTSTNLVAITGMSLTPTVPGTYLIHFEAQIVANIASKVVSFAIAYNGSSLTNATVSLLTSATTNTGYIQVSVTAFQTCNGSSDTLTVQHKSATSSTLTESYKVFYAYRVST